MIVDDQFLTVGSANLTNRSMNVDTELNLTMQTDEPDSALAVSIRSVRASLLAEHTGGAELLDREGVVEELERVAQRGEAGETEGPCRLRRHPSPTAAEKQALQLIDPQALPFDPDEEDLRRGPGRAISDNVEHLIRDFLGESEQT